MWILPKPLHTSAFVPDTEALISDLNEQSQACAQSLLVRSKPSPARTWSLKWKRDSWTQLLSGRILKPSHGPSFTAAWTSSVAATRASHSAPPVSVSAPKTQDTSGRTSAEELTLFDLESVSSRTSKDTLPSGCVTFCTTWASWVTERRLAFSARLKSALSTRGKESLSWPSVVASEVRQGFQDRSRGKKGSQESLTTAVVKDAANWRTPTAEALGTGKHMDTADLKLGARVYNKNGKLMAIDLNRQVEIVARQHGQAAPANLNTSGSRQGWWTPQVQDSKHSGTNPSSNGDRMLLVNQVNWSTPCSRDHHPNGQADGSKTDLGNQVTKQWATPQAHDAQGPKTPEQIAAMRAKGHGVKNLNEQACWGTPTARDHKSGRGNEDRQFKERTQSGKLNPRWVETLMGLPIGWTMPSCTSPQTIAPTSCDSSATEWSGKPQSELFAFSLGNCGNWTTPNQMDASIAKPTLRPSRIATGRKTDYLARQVSMIQES